MSEITTVHRPTITQYGADIPKEVLDNIPMFDSKQGELNEFLSTIESYSTMYRICKTDLVLLRSRGKVHEIISHAIAEDTDVEWSVIKRKLTSNYGSTRSGIEASVKILKLSMNSEETVGEYLARTKTLVKSKIKDTALWHSDIDEADAYHICNGLLKTGLKSRILQRVSKFKTYKDLFNNIEDEWERSYFMEDDFAGKEDTPSAAAEVDEIYAWNKTTTDDPTEVEMLTEVNEVYHKYGRYPTQRRYWTPGPDHTFNGTTPHASISYAPGTFNMGAPFSTHQQVPYNYQPNQLHTQNQQYRNNSFTEKQNNMTSQLDATALVEKLQQLILTHKNQAHQVNEVQVVTPKPSTTWDLRAAVKLPMTQEDQSE